MYEIAVITDTIRHLGFELAGIEGIYSATSPKECFNLLLDLVARKDIGIIMIADHLLPSGEEFDRIIMRSFPMIIIIPSGHPDQRTTSQKLMEFIQRSIGISIEI